MTWIDSSAQSKPAAGTCKPIVQCPGGRSTDMPVRGRTHMEYPYGRSCRRRPCGRYGNPLMRDPATTAGPASAHSSDRTAARDARRRSAWHSGRRTRRRTRGRAPRSCLVPSTSPAGSSRTPPPRPRFRREWKTSTAPGRSESPPPAFPGTRPHSDDLRARPHPCDEPL